MSRHLGQTKRPTGVVLLIPYLGCQFYIYHMPATNQMVVSSPIGMVVEATNQSNVFHLLTIR